MTTIHCKPTYSVTLTGLINEYTEEVEKRLA